MQKFRSAFLLFLFIVVIGSSADAASLKLAWDPPTDDKTAGYVVYYGTASGVYSTRVDIGWATSHRVEQLAEETEYFFSVRAYGKNGKLSEFADEVVGRTSRDDDDDDDDDEGPPDVAGEVVIYASDVTTRAGAWRHVTDQSAADNTLLRHANSGFRNIKRALRNPTHYFEATFNARRATPYRVWVRMRARGDAKANDSVFVQFSDTISARGRPIYRIGSVSSITENLRRCRRCESSGWGWTRRAFWLKDTGIVRFNRNGSHRIRIQTREDGVEIDQIVISSEKYLDTAPGFGKNDRTIVEKPREKRRSSLASAIVEESESVNETESFDGSVLADETEVPDETEVTNETDTASRINSSEPGDAGESVPEGDGAELPESIDAESDDTLERVDYLSGLTGDSAIDRDDQQPIVPPSVNATLSEEGVLAITWEASQMPAVAGYRVEIGATAGTTAFSAFSTDTSITFDTRGLATWIYFVRVRTITETAMGEPSEELMVTAVNAVPDIEPEAGWGQCLAPPRAPREFVASDDGTTVHLAWALGADAPPTGYVVEVGSAAGEWNVVSELGGEDTAMSATADAGTYILRVTAQNECGPSPWAAETVLVVESPPPHRR